MLIPANNFLYWVSTNSATLSFFRTGFNIVQNTSNQKHLHFKCVRHSSNIFFNFYFVLQMISFTGNPSVNKINLNSTLNIYGGVVKPVNPDKKKTKKTAQPAHVVFCKLVCCSQTMILILFLY